MKQQQQDQSAFQAYQQEQHSFGGGKPASQSTTITPTPAPAPAENPTVQTGDKEIAQQNSDALNAQNAAQASSKSTTYLTDSGSSQTDSKKKILGG